MKKIRFLLIATAIFASTVIQAQSFSADTKQSKIKWTGEKLTGKHWGFINLKSGELKLKNNNIVNGTFVIDMNSISCTDIEDDGYNKKLVGHLKSDDFFGVDKYPASKLVIKKASTFKNNKAKVTADLTIKKTTKPVEFEVTKSGNKYTAKIIVDRSKYDVRYGSKSFFDNLGDKVIYDDFVLEVDLVLASK